MQAGVYSSRWTAVRSTRTLWSLDNHSCMKMKLIAPLPPVLLIISECLIVILYYLGVTVESQKVLQGSSFSVLIWGEKTHGWYHEVLFTQTLVLQTAVPVCGVLPHSAAQNPSFKNSCCTWISGAGHLSSNAEHLGEITFLLSPRGFVLRYRAETCWRCSGEKGAGRKADKLICRQGRGISRVVSLASFMGTKFTREDFLIIMEGWETKKGFAKCDVMTMARTVKFLFCSGTVALSCAVAVVCSEGSSRCLTVECV